MPRLSVWFVRSSLIYLLIGFTVGAVMLAHKGIGIDYRVMGYISVHVDVVFIGWILNLALGVAYWMFPRFTPGKTSMAKTRGYETAAWTGFFLLNLGILVFGVAQIIGWALWGPFFGRILQGSGVAAFVINLWPRVKPVRTS